MLLSDKLKELREQTEQPQRKVAAALDIDAVTYSKIENGKHMPSRDFGFRLSKFFGYDNEQLIKLWLAERVVEVVKDEQVASEVMKLAVSLVDKSTVD